ncbi:glutamate formimidoyltransferase [Gottschalkiaceae bacterium SANA]|nr:glutamate formimidoyltransferase [Gottschalkiaceae bacterium SANA]
MDKKSLYQSVPNFSEGRDLKKVEAIVDCFRGNPGVKLLDYSSDADHNRSVVTVVGEPGPLKEALFNAVQIATELIDLSTHQGQHPRMGATDVIPFIPIQNASMEEARGLANDLAKRLGEELKIPVILYEESATAPHRTNLAKVRKGEFEAMKEKLLEEEWRPDFGPNAPHSTAGVTAVGARMPLVAFNVNLNTNDLSIASAIGKKVRHSSGGLRFVKAMGVALEDRGIVQVSMNMTNYTKTALYQAVEMVRFEAARYGVAVIGTELIGLAPMAALIDSAVYYMGLEDFSYEQVLETHLME